MNISASSNKSSTPVNYAGSSTADSDMQALYAQKQKLQERIESVKKNKDMDEKSKIEKVKELQDQITEIESTIRQQQAQKMQEAQKQQQEQQQSKSLDINTPAYINDVNTQAVAEENLAAQTPFNYMLQAGSIITENKTLASVKTAIENRLRSSADVGLENKTQRIDNAMSHDSRLTNVMQNISERIDKIDQTMTKANKAVTKEHDVADAKSDKETQSKVISDISTNIEEIPDNSISGTINNQDVSTDYVPKPLQSDIALTKNM